MHTISHRPTQTRASFREQVHTIGHGSSAWCVSAADAVAHRCAHPGQCVLVDLTDVSREHHLGNGVQAVAVDDRLVFESDPDVVELDLRCEASRRGGDLGDGDQRSDVDDLVASEDQDRAALASDRGQPDVPAVHSSPQVSASVQKSSTFSGERW